MAARSFFLRRIKLTNYKNYGFRDFEFSPLMNVLVGNNGMGKTNLLDAVYYTCFTKSYLTSSDMMVPQFGTVFFRVETEISLNSENQLIEIKYLKQEKKEVFVNKAKVEKQAEYIGKFPCVIIVPDDNQLILGGSELRRKFMDSTLSQFSTEYLTNLVTYNKILGHRNALLKSFYEQRTYDKNLLDVYNEKLATCGKIIFEYRKSLSEKLIPAFHKIYKNIFDGEEEVSIVYESDLLENSFEELLAQSEQHDRNAQRTTKGIHADDWRLMLNNFPVKKTGSQGQQKTFLLSLKLAQYDLLKQEKQIAPLLLLDDIFDKLDAERVNKIFRLIGGEDFGQVFITDTGEERARTFVEANNIHDYKIIHLGKE